jgi:putative tryptophan/tyrosine transport system substrate-binding protein
LPRGCVLELRYAAGNYEQFPDMAREVAQDGVTVILVNTISAVRAAQRLTPPVPVVMISINDPVKTAADMPGILLSVSARRE